MILVVRTYCAKFFYGSEITKGLINSKIIAEQVLEESYHGLIKENETFVEITPVIKVDEGKVCRLEIVKSQKDIPFRVKREQHKLEQLNN